VRLHNRQVKAAFWTDTELIRELPPEGRLFYLGLIQLADDSGCLEDDLMAFKIFLFPGDDSITLSILSEYRKTLVRLGKLIPYLSEGKACLYLKNFHKHQTLKTPSAPEVPLPSWVRFEPYPSNPRTGKYIVGTPESAKKDDAEPVREERLTHKNDVRTSSDTHLLQSPSNLEPELELELELEPEEEPERHNDASVCPSEPDGLDMVIETWRQRIGVMGPVQYESLKGWLEDPERAMPAEVIVRAIEIAADAGVKRLNYIEGILRNWVNDGVRTLEDIARAEQREHRSRGAPAETRPRFDREAYERMLREEGLST
jgi:DnaD/phage-associated family protein